jgi:PPK2 family polyphosphate:nucleotide phosphotransferase
MAKGSVPELLIVDPKKGIDLGSVDTGATPGAPGNKQETEAATAALRGRLAELQNRLWAERKQSLLIVLQAIDAGGKDGTIRKVFEGVNPQGCKVTSFKAPVGEDLEHDFLWRVHRAVPAKGEIGIFNRSHYEEVLIVRVHDIAPKTVWSKRYRIINDFEYNLTESRTTIVKFLLHISKEEQAQRLRARLTRPEKQWKFNPEDLVERALWDKYQVAFQDAVTKTSTEAAPWYVVPADRKWYRDYAVLCVLVSTLEHMDPGYPPPTVDPASVVIT